MHGPLSWSTDDHCSCLQDHAFSTSLMMEKNAPIDQVMSKTDLNHLFMCLFINLFICVYVFIYLFIRAVWSKIWALLFPLICWLVGAHIAIYHVKYWQSLNGTTKIDFTFSCLLTNYSMWCSTILKPYKFILLCSEKLLEDFFHFQVLFAPILKPLNKIVKTLPHQSDM